MEYYVGLNEIIDKIEDNLTEEINYNDLAKIIGTSGYTLQRIFCFLTGITLTNYIRKRRLSNAGEDLLLKNEKIIDLAIKYGYNSEEAFSRAFQKMYGMNPSDIKKGTASLRSFPKIVFKKVENDIKELEFRIIEKPEQCFYGISSGVILEEDKEAIKSFWNDCIKDGTYDFIKDNSDSKELFYSAYKYVDPDNACEKMKYYILGKKKRSDFEEFIIPKATWVAFRINSWESKDISELASTIYTKWFPTSSYNEILPLPDLEIYYDGYCEYCVAVEN